MDYIRPSVRLGEPNELELREYKEVDINNQIKLYVHMSLLNLDEKYSPQIDVEWKILGRDLVIKGL